MDIGEWLRKLSLQQYETIFCDNSIDEDVLRSLTPEDLKDLNITSVGHRRKILAAIAELSERDPAQPVEPPPLGPAVESVAERRQLTVLFCDLAGSTALSTQLDPEDMREVILAYQDCCSKIIAHYEGFVAKFMGDGVLAYFGFPQAHEDDAGRAVRAGLELGDSVAKLETRAGPLAVRIGIATGVVVVGDLVGEGAAQERAVVGDTPNLAARLQACTEPGGVIVSDLTRRLLGDAFVMKPLGPQALKGFDAPIVAWAVVREARTESRFEASQSSRLTPLVGRDPEVALLTEQWRDACAGEGKVVLLSGEPGIGKSRILAALREQIAGESHVAVRYQCSPHHVNDAYYPIIAQIWRAAEFAGEEMAHERLEKLEAMTRRSGLEPSEIVPFIASLCSVAFEERYGSLTLAPGEQKERLASALIALYEGLTKDGPVLALLEDAHWIDPSTLEVFGRLIERASRLRALLVITFRPEFVPPWMNLGHVHVLALSRLGRRHALALISRVVGAKPLPMEVLDQIVAKTDGVPLFVEELTKTVLESGLLREDVDSYALASVLTPLAIPSTLQDSLMARLDRLSPVKEIAQIGATIGREFSYSLLEAVSPIQGAPLQDALGQLTAAGLLFRHGRPPEVTYAFKHALVQDTAYATLLKSRRQHLHQQIATSLCRQFPERAEREPSVVAHHFTRAMLPELAMEWWGRAGDQAMQRFACNEAVEGYAKGLTFVDDLPPSEARDRRKLGLRLALGPALLAARGYASDEVAHDYEEAGRLAGLLSDREAAFTSARGLWHYYYDQGELNRAMQLAEQLAAIASESQSGEKSGLALRAVGSTLLNKAEFVRAIQVFERCIDERGDAALGVNLSRHGEEPQIVAMQYKGWALAVRGFADSGLAAVEAALSLAERTNYPLMVAFTASILGNVRLLRREHRECVALEERQLKYCAENRLVFWSAAHEIVRGAALACGAGDAAGLPRIQAGIRAWMKTGAQLHVPTWSSYLAESALCVGDHVVAEQALAQGFDACAKYGEAFALAELHRLNGRLLRLKSRQIQAREAFEHAFECAGRHEAGLYLLRAGRDLARALAEEGDRARAFALLSPIVEGISEHRGGLDFREAAALCSELAT